MISYGSGSASLIVITADIEMKVVLGKMSLKEKAHIIHQRSRSIRTSLLTKRQRTKTFNWKREFIKTSEIKEYFS